MTDVIWAARADAAAVADRVAAVIGRAGSKSIAVPGGRTPIPVFEQLPRRALPWRTVDITLTDDRLVPANHPASNFRILFDALGATSARLQPLVEGATPGRFDLVWLGVGTDGHIASLFPAPVIPSDTPPRVVRTRPDPLPADAPFERLTLTLAALTASEDIILVARGHAKRAVIEAAIRRDNDLPITRLIQADRCPITIFWSAA